MTFLIWSMYLKNPSCYSLYPLPSSALAVCCFSWSQPFIFEQYPCPLPRSPVSAPTGCALLSYSSIWSKKFKEQTLAPSALQPALLDFLRTRMKSFCTVRRAALKCGHLWSAPLDNPKDSHPGYVIHHLLKQLEFWSHKFQSSLCSLPGHTSDHKVIQGMVMSSQAATILIPFMSSSALLNVRSSNEFFNKVPTWNLYQDSNAFSKR